MKIYFSYSESDRDLVGRIRRDIREHDHSLVRNATPRQLDGSRTQNSMSRLATADAAIVCLSNFYIRTTWDNPAWVLEFFRRINQGEVYIIPLKLDERDVPWRLRPMTIVDFSDKATYEANLATLLRYLQTIELEKKETSRQRVVSSISGATRSILHELEEESIALPHSQIPIVDTLKKLPRSGKRIRLNGFAPHVEVRSVYDHVLSVAHLADCLLPHVTHKLADVQHFDLARLIAYHELSEVVLGDLPTFTSLDDRKRDQIRVYAEQRLRSVLPARRAQIANDFIWLFLNERHRQSMEAVRAFLDDRAYPLTIFFKLLDKIDPLVAVWRYLHEYRNRLGKGPEEFLRRMKDFFENPDVGSYVNANKFCEKTQELVVTLQNARLAEQYYLRPTVLTERLPVFPLPPSVLEAIIEGCPLFSDDRGTSLTNNTVSSRKTHVQRRTGGRATRR